MTLHIYDLDKTLVRKNASFAFYFYLLSSARLPLSTLLSVIPLYFRYQTGLSLEKLHREIFEKVLRGKPLSLFLGAVEPFLARFLKRELRSNLLMKGEGQVRWLLSSSPQFLVEPIAKSLGFDLWKGTEYTVDKWGKFCQISSLVDGYRKLTFAKEAPFQREQIVAYSDGEEDLPLLEWAGRACVVNPGKNLRKLAQQREWEIIK